MDVVQPIVYGLTVTVVGALIATLILKKMSFKRTLFLSILSGGLIITCVLITVLYQRDIKNGLSSTKKEPNIINNIKSNNGTINIEYIQGNKNIFNGAHPEKKENNKTNLIKKASLILYNTKMSSQTLLISSPEKNPYDIDGYDGIKWGSAPQAVINKYNLKSIDFIVNTNMDLGIIDIKYSGSSHSIRRKMFYFAHDGINYQFVSNITVYRLLNDDDYNILTNQAIMHFGTNCDNDSYESTNLLVGKGQMKWIFPKTIIKLFSIQNPDNDSQRGVLLSFEQVAIDLY